MTGQEKERFVVGLHLAAIIAVILALSLSPWDLLIERDGDVNILMQIIVPSGLLMVFLGLYWNQRS